MSAEHEHHEHPNYVKIWAILMVLLAISVIGRNLLTWSAYNGYDPEVGRDGGDTGSAAIARVDGFNYPNFRTFTAAIEVNF